MPEVVTGNSNIAVSASVAGLVQGLTYYYRIVAMNVGGTAVSGQQSFQTPLAPMATVGSAIGLNTVSARVFGNVNPNGSPTTAVFEYGTNAVTFDNSVAATPSTVIGMTNTEVSATLVNLVQGTTYYFRVRATSAGGVSLSQVATFNLAVLSGFTQRFPGQLPDSPGFILVNIVPPVSGSGWRFVGEKQWRATGTPLGGLTLGTWLLEFRPVPGYNQPPRETIILTTNSLFTDLERTYYEAPTAGSGGLNVTLKPDSIAVQAQWRFLGETDAQWRNSGDTASGLIAGSYLVESKPLTNYAAPAPRSVLVVPSQTTAITLTYAEPAANVGISAQLVPFETVTTSTNLPYGYVGQLRSDDGLGSGFVVKPRVVATAAHVVFNDVFSNGIPIYVTGLQWLFQRNQGSYEPIPQIPRGFYVFDGYAAARNESGVIPGEGTPKSQYYDASALYFLADAGRGGFSGYLASDSIDNEFLVSDANKILAGYPIDDIEASKQGRIHATPPANVTLSRVPGQVLPGIPYRTYTTAQIGSTGGSSGGPLCIQFEGGSYYPAAIYLGGAGETVVRGIDSAVVELFGRAETSANGGGNNTSGGITHTDVTTFGPPTDPGSLKVIIEPAEARAANAGWRLSPDLTLRFSGSQKAGLSPGTYTLQCSTVAGFPPPSPTNVVVIGGSLTTITFTYGSGELENWRLMHFGTTENVGVAADNADPDGDGSVNINEFIAGTDPNQSNDVFKILSVTRLNSSCSLKVAGKQGRTYELLLLSPNNLGSTNIAPAWTTRASIGPLDGDTELLLTDPINHANAAIYRVRVSRP